MFQETLIYNKGSEEEGKPVFYEDGHTYIHHVC